MTQATSTSSRWRMLWILPPLILGVLLLVFFVKGKQPPALAEQQEIVRAVRTIEATEINLVPRAEGYGLVQPAQVWSAVAQVSGQIVELHPRLRNGEILPAQTLLYRIDPVDYELALAQAQADLEELGVQAKNAQASLSIETRQLSLLEAELNRVKTLSKQGSISQSKVDETERSLLNSRASVQNLRNTLALLEPRKKSLHARIEQAKRDLAHTEVRAPFNLRIAKLNAEVDQFVSKGQVLFVGDSVDRVEILAQFEMSALRKLLPMRKGAQVPRIEQLSHLAELLHFDAKVLLDLGAAEVSWDADFVRFSDDIDAQTRTLGVVLAVDKPLEKIIPGQRPLLSKGMFVRALLRGATQAQRLVVPRHAVRGGEVLLVDAQQRLQRQPVEILFNQDDISVISSGLSAGQQVVVSDLSLAIDGLRLAPQPDESLQQHLLSFAEAAQ